MLPIFFNKKKYVKIIITRGIPGSGKTTWAKNFVKNNPNYIRISRDDLRSILIGKWDWSIEDVVKSLRLI